MSDRDVTPRTRSKAWAFTLNNPGNRLIVFDAANMDYLVFQRERGAEAGTLHLQGYVRFKVRKDLRAAKNCIDDGAHLERARGTEKDNRDYCTKEEGRDAGPWEFGVYNGDANKQGARSDLKKATDAVASGASMRQVARENPEVYVRYHTGLQALANIINEPPISRDVQILVLWGPTGTGKTHRVMTNESLRKDGGIYCAPTAFAAHPFDGYSQEKTLFLDEFRWENWPAIELNKILDKWTYQLPCRYMNKYALWTRIVICSNQTPLSWYPNEDLAIRDAVRRRLGSSCRLITNREDNPDDLPPNPDFAAVNEPLFADPTQMQTQD